MKPVKLFLTDVDGCMTDGGMYYSANGDEMKRFCVYDGMGIVLLRKAGIPCGILTSETTEIVAARARKLGMDYLRMGVGSQIAQNKQTKLDATQDKQTTPTPKKQTKLEAAQEKLTEATPKKQTKLEAAQEICAELGISLEEVCFVGDDINDLDLLQAVGTPACPTNAVGRIKNIPGIIHLTRHGGDGAIRELADLLLTNLIQ